MSDVPDKSLRDQPLWVRVLVYLMGVLTAGLIGAAVAVVFVLAWHALMWAVHL